jgi:glycosyltransferase involved in cell wall biosynthesis
MSDSPLEARSRVAVIIPCFNDGEFLREAVESVREPEPIELVVVDDGSRDDATLATLDELERTGVRVLRHDINRGLSAARNTGLRHTRASYVFPLDADDLAVPGVLARMADVLDEHPWAIVCYGDYEVFGSDSFVRRTLREFDPFRIAYRNELTATALFRRTALDEAGGWRPVVAGASGADDIWEDWHLWMTLAERGARGIHAGEGVLTYRRRMHAPRLTAAGQARRRRQYRALKAAHPALFSMLKDHRRRSSLPGWKKLLYPLVFANRPRLPLEYRIKAALERRAGSVDHR